MSFNNLVCNHVFERIVANGITFTSQQFLYFVANKRLTTLTELKNKDFTIRTIATAAHAILPAELKSAVKT